MNNDIKKLFSEKIQEAQGLSHPRVLVNICSHGNEVIGLDIKSMCDDLKIENGSLTFNIGNPEATKKKERFIESDLNRSFPGSESGTYEEQIAFYMMQYVKLFDYIIDIHSTVSGMENCLIIEDDSPEIQQLISVCNNCDTVLHMIATKGKSIFTACRQSDKIIPGITFEYGNNSDYTVQKTYDDLICVLSKIGIITEIKNFSISKLPDQFECYSIFSKQPSDILGENILNYKLVKKGETVGYTEQNIPIIAPDDFYPILFREKNYETIFGFMARKL